VPSHSVSALPVRYGKLRLVYKFKKPSQMDIFGSEVNMSGELGHTVALIIRKGKWKGTNRGQRTGMCSGEMHIAADITSSF